jgi:arylformamidase
MRIIDLSLTLRAGMRGVSWETANSFQRDGWNARLLHLYSHAGTHMDAQTHFEAGPETIDAVPLDRCAGPAWVASVPDLSPGDPVRLEHLHDLRELFIPGESLLIRTGWSAYVDDAAVYRDGLPPISEELATWCVTQRVKLLGVEPPSVADVRDRRQLTRIHTILLGGGVTIVEGLTALDQIQERRIFFAALPLKIAGGDGCPCRALAIEGLDL